MAVLIECACHLKQSAKNKVCRRCAANLDKLKKNPTARWWINYRVEGRQRTEYVGHSRREAIDAMGKRRAQIREHRIFDILPQSKMTFPDLAAWYLALPATKGVRSFNRIKSAIKYAEEYFGDKPLENLQPADVENFIAAKLADGLKPATVNLLFIMAKMVINKGFSNDIVGPRALKAFKIAKAPMKAGSNVRTRTVGLDEFLKLMDVAPHFLKMVFTLALYCGMRRGEMCDLRRSNIDYRAGFIRLLADQTKERRPKSIPMPETVRQMLKDTPPAFHDDHVILDKGRPLSVGILTYALEVACKKAGILYGARIEGGFKLHDLRATWKTLAAKAGVDQSIRNKILGHSLQGMDVFYLRFDDDDLRAGMAKYTTYLEAELENAYQSAHQKASG